MAWRCGLALYALMIGCAGCAPVTSRPTAEAPAGLPSWPQLVVQSGHHSIMADLAFSPDNRWLISGNQDGTIKIWDLATGRELRTFVGHTGMVWRLAVSRDGRRLASTSNDGTTRLWDVDTGRALHIWRHRGPAWAVALSPDASLVAAGGADRIVQLWDAASGERRRTLDVGQEVNRITFVGDAGALAIGAGPDVTMWDARTGRKVGAAAPHGDIVLSLAASQHGRWLVSGSLDGEIRVLALDDGWRMHTVAPAIGPHHGVYSLAFSPDGQLLAAQTIDGLRIWATATWTPIASAPTSTAGESMPLAFSPDGRWLALAGQSSLRVWDTARWRLHVLLGTDVPERSTFTLGGDGRLLAFGSSDGAIRLWDLASGGAVRTIRSQRSGIWSVALSPDARWVVASAARVGSSTDVDRVIRVWSVQDPTRHLELAGHTDGVPIVAFSPDGSILASGSWDHTVRLWDPATGRMLRTLTGHTGQVNTIAFSPDGRLLASGAGLVDYRQWRGDEHAVDRTIKLWDVASGREVRTLTGSAGEVVSLAFSPDGRWLASASGTIEFRQRGGGAIDGIVRLWDAGSGRLVRELRGPGGPGTVAFSPNGQWLAVSGVAIQLREMPGGRLVGVLRPPRPVQTTGRVQFSADGRWVFAGCGEGALCVWSVATRTLVASLVPITTGADWLTVTPDGLFDGSPRGWKRILWRFSERTVDVAPVEVFFREYYHPGLLAEILAGKAPHAARDISAIDRRQARVALALGGAPTARDVEVRVTVAEAQADAGHPVGAGARDVRLFRNGSLVKVWHGDVLGGRPEVTLDATVAAVAGEQVLTAYAFNADNIKSEDAELTVEGAEALRRPGIAYVIAVGLNIYANRAFNLRYAVPDARQVATVVGGQLTRLGRYRDTRIIRLEDEQATRANLVHALARLAGVEGGPAPETPQLETLARAEPEDTIIIYFAGHGAASHGRFYLLPHDLGYRGPREEVDAAAMTEIAAHSLSDLDMGAAFEGIDAGRLALIVDACNSGQALESDEWRQGPLNSRGLAQLAYDKGMDILTAAQGYQAALESRQLGHGLLTYALVEEALKSDAADTDPRDGVVSAREWFDYAVRRVPQLQRAMMDEARTAGREGVDRGRRRARRGSRPAQPPTASRVLPARRRRGIFRGRHGPAVVNTTTPQRQATKDDGAKLRGRHCPLRPARMASEF
jgi:WD40 repeat protein